MKNNKKAEKEKVISSALTADTLEVNASNVQQDNQPQKTSAPANNAKKAKAGNVKKGDNAFVRFFKRIGRSFKEMGSELKKVSWPTIGKALTSTGIVLAFVVIFLAVLMGIDALFGFGFNELIGIQG